MKYILYRKAYQMNKRDNGEIIKSKHEYYFCKFYYISAQPLHINRRKNDRHNKSKPV